MMKKALFCLTLTGALFTGALQLMASTKITCETFCENRYLSCQEKGISENICYNRYWTCMNDC